MDKKDIVQILRRQGINPSYQRINIYEYLHKNKIHPTVDNIYRDLIEALPTLSKTTVYNTVDLFVEKGLVKALQISEGENRYEIIIEDHSHFKCELCNSIVDIPLESMEFLPETHSEYEIKDVQVLINGICPKCINK